MSEVEIIDDDIIDPKVEKRLLQTANTADNVFRQAAGHERKAALSLRASARR